MTEESPTKKQKVEGTKQLDYKDIGRGDDIDKEKLGVCAIASPFAGPKMRKRCYKLISKARAKGKGAMWRGVKEVVKRVNKKGEQGVIFIAGNITPVDVISHIPIVCEEKNIPYVFLPSKEDIGTAAGTKRSIACIIVCTPAKDTDETYKELFKRVKKDIKKVEIDWTGK